jgi:hypothetical protein
MQAHKQCHLLWRSERQEEQIGRVGLEGEERYCKLDTERFLQKPISNVDFVKIRENNDAK